MAQRWCISCTLRPCDVGRLQHRDLEAVHNHNTESSAHGHLHSHPAIQPTQHPAPHKTHPSRPTDSTTPRAPLHQVYKGKWRGLEVAVKTVLFSEQRNGTEQRAIMEAAVCASVVHPNVVCTYHYDITPVRGETTARLVVEHTEVGFRVLGGCVCCYGSLLDARDLQCWRLAAVAGVQPAAYSMCLVCRRAAAAVYDHIGAAGHGKYGVEVWCGPAVPCCKHCLNDACCRLPLD